MKKLIAIMCVLAVSVCVLACFVGCQADDATKTSADGNWTYLELEDGTVSLANYIGTDADVVVPAAVDGKVVSSLEQGLFLKTYGKDAKRRLRDVYQPNEVVRTVTFAAQVAEIPARTFYLCTALTQVNLPVTCTSVGDFAFYWCKSLATITFPAACEGIGAYCFRECGSLAEVIILNPELIKVGDKCFYMVNEKESGDNQYYIIEGLVISPVNPTVYNSNDIEVERRKTKSNDYRYWQEYIDNGNVVGGTKTAE